MQIRKLIVSSFKKGDRYDSCADPGIFRQFGGGGGGRVQVHLAYKKSSDNVFLFLFLFFFCPKLILQKSSGYFQRKLLFAEVPVGVEHFPGVQLFTGGPIAFSL